jgi:hypothetical protein
MVMPARRQPLNEDSCMEIKIECFCGQRYKFEVVPEAGRMPVPVNCPTCGAEGTDAANGLIQQALAAQAIPPPLPQARVRVTAAPPA